jgi:alditol oxidase
MKKRTFVKSTSAFVGGVLLAPYLGCTTKTTNKLEHTPLKNWAENLQYSTDKVLYPSSVKEIQELIPKLDKARVLGSRHSFNTIADSVDQLIATSRLNGIVELDAANSQITVEGGIKYGELCHMVEEQGFAFHNLASLPHISVAGSIATATHGSGLENGNLASSVKAIEFVDATGELHKIKKGDPDFDGAVVGLGALGLVTAVTLELVPSFEVAQSVYVDMPFEALKSNFLQIMGAGYSVSLFTDWKDGVFNEVWVKKKIDKGSTSDFPETLFGASLATENLHPVPGQSGESCTEQMGLAGPWYQRLPHFKMEFQPSAGRELQSEYFVPLEHAYEAIMAVAELSRKISPLLFISEIRTVKRDGLWLSPAYDQDVVAIHTTWKQEIPEVMALLPEMEAKLAPFSPRPHWGKLFTFNAEQISQMYPKLNAFKDLISKYDPKGKFQNEFILKNIFGG